VARPADVRSHTAHLGTAPPFCKNSQALFLGIPYTDTFIPSFVHYLRF
jgi:hypothetical protein